MEGSFPSLWPYETVAVVLCPLWSTFLCLLWDSLVHTTANPAVIRDLPDVTYKNKLIHYFQPGEESGEALKLSTSTWREGVKKSEDSSQKCTAIKKIDNSHKLEYGEVWLNIRKCTCCVGGWAGMGFSNTCLLGISEEKENLNLAGKGP